MHVNVVMGLLTITYMVSLIGLIIALAEVATAIEERYGVWTALMVVITVVTVLVVSGYAALAG